MKTTSLHQQALDSSSTYHQRERWTRQQLKDYQMRTLDACRRYAYAHSPFYQKFHRGLMDRPLHELPILTKTMVMENFDELVTDRAIHLQDVQRYLAQADPSRPFLDRYQVKATSGSSGQPGFFLTDSEESAILTDSFTRFVTWGGVTLESRVAVVASAAPAHMSANFPLVINGQRVPRLQLSSNDQLETLVHRLNEFQPEVLLWYPTIASTLAHEQQQGRLQIQPRSIFCGAEPLSHEMRRSIEEAWHTRIYDVYASTEGGVIASECERHDGMHLFEDFSLIEVVDQNGRPLPPGEKGDKVLLTVPFRRIQPLIRYEISDMVRLSTSQSCACGRQLALMEAVKGRTGEMLYFPTISGKDEGITTLQFETIFDMKPLTGWQILQDQDGLHIFLTGALEEMQDTDLLDALRQMFVRRGVIVPTMDIHRVTTLSTNANGKAPMILSRLPPRSA